VAVMPMTMIKGSYRILGASPDGDSVRFYPDDPAVWAAAGITVRTNAADGVQLRLDAIDALETTTPLPTPLPPAPTRRPRRRRRIRAPGAAGVQRRDP
jgi:hypothetical protein